MIGLVPLRRIGAWLQLGPVADDLTRMARRLAGDRLPDGHSASEPQALLDMVEQRLAAPPDTTDPEIDFVALRMGVGLGRLARLANG